MGIDRLVYDVGMHKGEDTEFYLERGMRVIGVEANPALVKELRNKFATELRDDRLVIVDKAISRNTGTAHFALNRGSTEWGSLADKYIARNTSVGAGENDYVEVETVNFSEILRRFGVPYYLKIDIEGMDMACLEALQGFDTRPQYLSIETAATTGVASFEEAFGELAQLWSLGYRSFKFVDQARLGRLEGTTMTAEGPPLRYRYRQSSSGPFGEESPGQWTAIEPTIRHMRSLVRYQNTIGLGGRYGDRLAMRIARRLRRYAKRLPSHSWYDLHARLAER
jgi:FkbM family methyltransferase